MLKIFLNFLVTIRIVRQVTLFATTVVLRKRGSVADVFFSNFGNRTLTFVAARTLV